MTDYFARELGSAGAENCKNAEDFCAQVEDYPRYNFLVHPGALVLLFSFEKDNLRAQATEAVVA